MKLTWVKDPVYNLWTCERPDLTISGNDSTGYRGSEFTRWSGHVVVTHGRTLAGVKRAMNRIAGEHSPKPTV